MLEFPPRQTGEIWPSQSKFSSERVLNMELSIVVLNWNAADDTIRCVASIDSWPRLRSTVVVVDNASSDDSVSLISQACPNIHLVRNAQNLGFAAGTNRGITKALELRQAPVLLLNNDAVIGEPDLVRLLKTLEDDERIGLVGPLLYDAEKKDTLISAGGKNPILHHHTRIRKLEAGDAVRPTAYVSGTAVVIRPGVVQAVGLLDESYFFSTELADLCMRARHHGYYSAIDTRARAYHRLSRSSGLRDTLYVYYIVRNRFIFIRNSYYRTKVPFFVFWTAYSLALSLKLYLSGKLASAHAVRLGLVDGLRGRFGGQNERVLAACSK